MKMNEINQDRLIEVLYYELHNEELSKNIVETEEISAAFHEYNDKYINPLYTISYDIGSEAYDKLTGLLSNYSHRSFEVGFKAALALLDTDTKAVKA